MKQYGFYGGLLCVTAATLMLQLIQVRILSVVAWYYLAFFVISTAMFGLTAGAVWVYLRKERFSEKTLSYDLANYSVAFAVSILLALAFQMTLAPMTLPAVTTFLIWCEMAVFLAVPFFFSGVVVALALTRSPYPIGRVYAVDLIGAAAGCFGVLALLNISNGPTAVLWTSVLAALGALLFQHSGIGSLPHKRPTILWLLVLAAAATSNGFDDQRHGLYPIYAKHVPQLLVLPWFEKWNSFSRITAGQPRETSPAMWGPAPIFDGDEWRLRQSYMAIDGAAGTAAYGLAGDLSRAGFLTYDITNLAYYLPDRQKAAVIGVGGGRDVISARLFGVPNVTGVEINPAFIDLLLHDPEFSAFVGLNKIDGVELIVDEARSWFARSDDAFDVIQMSLIDTWAATTAGAYSLTENGLYTVEAWNIFLDRLTPQGVFTVSRWYSPENISETGRLVSLAIAALFERGVENPKDHIFIAKGQRIATLIISPAGFNSSELHSLKTAVRDLGFEVLVAPDEPTIDVLSRLFDAKDRPSLERIARSFYLDMTPPTDNRPFFFNQLPLYDAAKVALLAVAGQSLGVATGNLFATATLVMLFFISLALVIAAIVIPLRHALKDVGQRLAVGGTAYFMLIGVGFMLVEIALLQRFSVFLGHPTYALSIVLFSLILSTGIGSLLSDSYGIEKRSRFVCWAIATSFYIATQALWVPPLLLQLDSTVLVARVLATLGIILPAGLLMGYGFPTGMRFISRVNRKPTPWFWGINGASGVLASTVAVACSIAYGISTTLVLGAFCYLLLIPAAFVISTARKNPIEAN